MSSTFGSAISLEDKKSRKESDRLCRVRFADLETYTDGPPDEYLADRVRG